MPDQITDRITAIHEVMAVCRKCEKAECHSPCNIASEILEKHNLRYEGDDP